MYTIDPPRLRTTYRSQQTLLRLPLKLGFLHGFSLLRGGHSVIILACLSHFEPYIKSSTIRFLH